MSTVHETQNASAPSRNAANVSTWRALGAILVVAFVVTYLAFVIRCSSPYAGGADSSGYLNSARLILSGRMTEPVSRIEGLAPPDWSYVHHQPLGFKAVGETGWAVPLYPVGLPLHLAAAGIFAGLERAPTVINTLLVAAAGALMVALARRFRLPWFWAIASAALLWASPLYALNTLQPMSDLPATVWVLAAIWCALCARDSGKMRWASAAGWSVAMAVLVRPTNLLVLAPLAVALGWRPRTWGALVLGGLPGAVFLAWYNHALHGGALNTGYGSVVAWFKLEYAPHNFRHFVVWLFMLLSPPVALAACGLPWLWQREPLLGRLVLVWSAAFIGFYLFYFYSGQEWWYLRFILPMFPAAILGGMAVAYHASERMRSPRGRVLVPAIMLVLALGWDLWLARKRSVHWISLTDEAYKAAAEWMQAEAPPNAIVLQMQLSGAFAYYADFAIVRWDLLEPETTWPMLLTAARQAHRPIYAALYDFEVEPALSQHAPGEWKQVKRIRQMSLWRLTEPSGASP